MNYTLLRMTQLILSSMDSDEINSITDTVEAQQVVDIIETTYNDIVSAEEFPSHYDLFELTEVGDTDTPTLIQIPSNVNKIEWLQYDWSEDGATTRNMQQVVAMSRYAFFDRMNAYDTSDSTTYQYDYTVGVQTFDVRGRNDAFPSYFTTVDNNYLIFDNYRADIENTVTGGRTMGYGSITPTFTRSDGFTPDLDDKNFTILFNEAKATCWADLKQAQNQKAEQRARRGWVRAAKDKSKVMEAPALQQVQDYGRKRRARVSGVYWPPKSMRGS